MCIRDSDSNNRLVAALQSLAANAVSRDILEVVRLSGVGLVSNRPAAATTMLLAASTSALASASFRYSDSILRKGSISIRGCFFFKVDAKVFTDAWAPPITGPTITKVNKAARGLIT